MAEAAPTASTKAAGVVVAVAVVAAAAALLGLHGGFSVEKNSRVLYSVPDPVFVFLSTWIRIQKAVKNRKLKTNKVF